MSKSYTLLALLVSMALTAQAQTPTPESRVLQKEVAPDGSPTLITFGPGSAHYAAAEASKALREQLKLAKEEEMVSIKTEADDLGMTHEKYQQYYRGIKVEHAVYSVHTKAGKIESLTGRVSHIGQLDVLPQLAAKAALERALAIVGAKRYMWQVPEEETGLKQRENNASATYLPKGELVVLTNAAGQPTLAWKFDIYAQEPLSRAYLYVDAATGSLVLRDAILKHAAPFATRYSSTRNIETQANPGGGYRLRETNRGNGVETYNLLRGTNLSAAVDFVDVDNDWTAAEYDNANYDNAAGDAHFGAESTYDYWKNVHGRTSWDNAGGKLRSYVHYGQGYDNAFWDGAQMVYGDGSTTFKPLTSLDVAGHEIGHGVCQATAGLVYQGESGALNEGFSDIWGACIEQYTTAALGLTKSTWLIGEEIVKSGTALRSMSNPRSLGQPGYYRGANWYTGSGDNGGVHTNSGVINHWFYILSQGENGTNEGGKAYSVASIGISSAARIAYRAESVYMTANNQYADARTYTIQAATDIFGSCSAEVTAVTNAWYAVGVGAAAPVPTITGPDQVCSSSTGTYQTNSANTVWTASPANLFTVTSGSGTQFSTAGAAGAQGTGTITATLCGASTTKTVAVGDATPTGTYRYNTSSYTLQGTNFIQRNGNSVYVQVSLSQPYNFTFTCDNPNIYLSSSSNTTSFTIPTSVQNGFKVYATATGSACGSSGYWIFVPTGYAYAVAPNPAGNELAVSDQTADPAAPATAAPFEAELYDTYGKKVKAKKSDRGKAVLDIRDLPNGLYNLRIGKGKDSYTDHIQITH